MSKPYRKYPADPPGWFTWEMLIWAVLVALLVLFVLFH